MEHRPQGDASPVVAAASAAGPIDVSVLRGLVDDIDARGVVITAEGSDVHPSLVTAAAEGRPGITGRSSTDAVKRVQDGAVAESVDRDRVFLVELPIAVPFVHLAERVAELTTHGIDEVHPAALLTGIDLDDVTFVDRGQGEQPSPPPNG